MNDSQRSDEQKLYESLCPLTQSIIDPYHSHFADKKTQSLYNKLLNIRQTFFSDKKELIKQAERTTRVNSHFTTYNPTQIQHLLDNCYIIEGVALKQQHNPPPICKNRSYSIIKIEKKRKSTLTSEQFEDLKKGFTKNTQIIYSYNTMQLKSRKKQFSNKTNKNVQSRYLKLSSKRSSQKEFGGASTQVNTKVYARQIAEPVDNSRPYQFTKISKKGVQMIPKPSNCFNFLDQPVNLLEKQGIRGCFCPSFEPISKKIKPKPWNLQ